MLEPEHLRKAVAEELVTTAGKYADMSDETATG